MARRFSFCRRHRTRSARDFGPLDRISGPFRRRELIIVKMAPPNNISIAIAGEADDDTAGARFKPDRAPLSTSSAFLLRLLHPAPNHHSKDNDDDAAAQDRAPRIPPP